MKETFIIRTEWHTAISELEPESQAIIFNNLFHYHSGNENLINLNNLGVKLVWRLIEPNLKRNVENYDRRKETSRENGKKGGRPLKNSDLEKPNNLNKKPKQSGKPTETLSVFVSDDNNTNVLFKNFQNWILKNAPNVSKMKEPFTEDQYIHAKEKIKIEVLKEVLVSMHNHKPLLQKNISAYLTALNWAERRNESKNGYHPEPVGNFHPALKNRI